MMSLLFSLADAKAWERFYEYKTALVCPKEFAKELREFIDARAYLPVVGRIAAGEPFPFPRKAIISKLSTQKKRTVYIYPRAENIVLKFLTYLLLRRYDSIFADNLYSFRPGRTAKDAFRMLLRTPGIGQMYSYKADVHNYFNSVPVEKLLPMLEVILCPQAGSCQKPCGDEAFLQKNAEFNGILRFAQDDRLFCKEEHELSKGRKNSDTNPDGILTENSSSPKAPLELSPHAWQQDCFLHTRYRFAQDDKPEGDMFVAPDPALYQFLRELLTEPRVLYEGEEVTEEKGIMAGTPLASFYANVYLKDLDFYFQERKVPYIRYSDDIILFGRTREEVEGYADIVRGHLAKLGLGINPEKEEFRGPEEGFVFLGFSYRDGVVDIAPVTVRKLKKKMWRKTRALRRWRLRNGAEGEAAAKAFLRVFRRKLFEGAKDSDLTWSRWFFSVINTDESLREIDHYAQECVRYLVSGKRTKARFNVRYHIMKELGYKSLVHAYYSFRKEVQDEAP